MRACQVVVIVIVVVYFDHQSQLHNELKQIFEVIVELKANEAKRFTFNRLRAIWPKGYQRGCLGRATRTATT